MCKMINMYINPKINDIESKKIYKDLNKHNVVLIIITEKKPIYENIISNFLNIKQRNKKDKYLKYDDRYNYGLSHAIINKLFHDIEKKDVEKIEWKQNKYGKPYVINHKNLQFNISHTKGAVAVAIFENEIGVDIEYLNKNFAYEDIEDLILNNKEKTIIKSIEDFYYLWTMKEAYLKLRGIGLIQNMRTVEVVEKDTYSTMIKDNNKIQRVNSKKIKLKDYIIALCF